MKSNSKDIYDKQEETIKAMARIKKNIYILKIDSIDLSTFKPYFLFYFL